MSKETGRTAEDGNCLCQHPTQDHQPRCVSCGCFSFMSVEDFEGIVDG